jgi:hypothetical protein
MLGQIFLISVMQERVDPLSGSIVAVIKRARAASASCAIPSDSSALKTRGSLPNASWPIRRSARNSYVAATRLLPRIRSHHRSREPRSTAASTAAAKLRWLAVQNAALRLQQHAGRDRTPTRVTITSPRLFCEGNPHLFCEGNPHLFCEGNQGQGAH